MNHKEIRNTRLVLAVVNVSIFVLIFVGITTLLFSPSVLSEDEFLSKISKLTVTINYENSDVGNREGIPFIKSIVASGVAEDFRVKYQLYSTNHLAKSAYELIISELKMRIFDGTDDSELISNELVNYGKFNQISVSEYATRTNNSIYRVINYKNVLILIEVGVNERAYSLSNYILELLELK